MGFIVVMELNEKDELMKYGCTNACTGLLYATSMKYVPWCDSWCHCSRVLFSDLFSLPSTTTRHCPIKSTAQAEMT
jgi:hypothetical protein